MLAYSNIVVVTIFGVQMLVVFWHFLASYDAVAPLVNDQLLHLLEVRRITQILYQQSDNGQSLIASWRNWILPARWSAWVPLQAIDHVLGSHGLGFPFLLHYQHLPHVLVGVVGALLKDPDLAFALSSAVGVGILLPTALFASLVYVLDSHPLAAALSVALIPVINDAPPAAQGQQGFQYSYGLGWGAFMHGGHGLWTQIFAGACVFPAFALACRALCLLDTPPSFRCQLKFGVLAGLFLGGCSLCNVLYGYMVGCMVSAAAVVAVLDRLLSMRRKGNADLDTEAPRGSRDQEAKSESARRKGTAGNDVKSTGILFEPFLVFSIIATNAMLVSAYFIVPHLIVAKQGVISNYEARDYKITGEGLSAAVSVFSSGNLLDHGWRDERPHESMRMEAGHLLDNTIFDFSRRLSEVIACVPKLPVISGLTLVGWASVVLDVVGGVRQHRKSITTTSSTATAQQRRRSGKESAAFLAARAATILLVAFLVLYGGYGTSSGHIRSGASQMGRARRRAMSPEAAAAAAAAKAANMKASQFTWNESTGKKTLEAVFLVVLENWNWLWNSYVTRFLAFAVEHLPMIKVLHLHRFLGGVHAMSLLLVPCAVEGLARLVDNIFSPFIFYSSSAAASLKEESSRRDHFPKRASSHSRGLVLCACFLLLSPLYERRWHWLVEVEAPQRARRLQAAKLSSPHISKLIKRLKSLPPGRVWAGDRDSARNFQSPTVKAADNSLDAVDDLLFVHLQQRAASMNVSKRSLDVVGPLLHGLSKAADLIPEVDMLRSPAQRRVLGVAYVVLPRKWWFPERKAPLPEEMVEVDIGSPPCDEGSNGVCQIDGVGYYGEHSHADSPYRLFVDENLNHSSPSSSYFSVARVLSVPTASSGSSKETLRPTDAYFLSTKTAAYLRSVAVEKKVAEAAAVERVLVSDDKTLVENCPESPPSPPPPPPPASAAVTHSLAHGWLQGLAASSVDSPQDGMSSETDPLYQQRFKNVSEALREASAAANGSSKGGRGLFFLAWPSQPSFQPPLVADRAETTPQQLPEKWGKTSPETFALITAEVVSPDLSTFQCEVLVLPSTAARAQSERHHLPDASLVLSTSYHPGWACSVSTLSSGPGSAPVKGTRAPLVVSEAVPGFPFVHLFAVPISEGAVLEDEPTRREMPSWATQQVTCSYEPSFLKFSLLIAAMATLGLSVAAVCLL